MVFLSQPFSGEDWLAFLSPLLNVYVHMSSEYFPVIILCHILQNHVERIIAQLACFALLILMNPFISFVLVKVLSFYQGHESSPSSCFYHYE